MTLDRVLSRFGLASRRDARQAIQAGRLKVNGKVVRDAELAARLGPRVCETVISSSVKDREADLQLVANVRAGNVPMPADSNIDPFAALMFAETGATPQLQAALAAALGPEVPLHDPRGERCADARRSIVLGARRQLAWIVYENDSLVPLGNKGEEGLSLGPRPHIGHEPGLGKAPLSTSSIGALIKRATRSANPALGLPFFEATFSTALVLTCIAWATFSQEPKRMRRMPSTFLTLTCSFEVRA
jgi:hypothetical protein